jgi:membrane associated rhomboid family serine protease
MASHQARFFVLVWVLLNAAVPLIPLLTGEPVEIAWQAHLGGFFTGLLLVPLFERRLVWPPGQ